MLNGVANMLQSVEHYTILGMEERRLALRPKKMIGEYNTFPPMLPLYHYPFLRIWRGFRHSHRKLRKTILQNLSIIILDYNTTNFGG